MKKILLASILGTALVFNTISASAATKTEQKQTNILSISISGTDKSDEMIQLKTDNPDGLG